MRAAMLFIVTMLLTGAVMPAAAWKPPTQRPDNIASTELLLFWTPPRHQSHKFISVDHYEVTGKWANETHYLKNVSSTTFTTMVPKGYQEYAVRAVWSTPRAGITPICVVSYEYDTGEIIWHCEHVNPGAVISLP